ncbi:MAG: hypothetical protein AAB421_00745 [Patescibacteria group bacterium]
MTKTNLKKNPGISQERLKEFKRATLIASTGSSLRLSGSKVTNEEVEQILNAVSKPSEQK